MIEILGQLAHEQGYCVIIVTHDPSIAERSDKVWSMSDGGFDRTVSGCSIDDFFSSNTSVV
ncbi:MAG: hypothetical protein IH593_14505 [Bacteroidales bacterium]|nr:hypothetical protein [Bacteroidales bacterium]